LRDEARSFDLAERPFEASAAYERAIDAGECDLEVYLDLAVLYWVSTDCGFYCHHRLSEEFIATAEARSRELLSEAEQRFGPSNEVEFWRLYFDFITYGSELTRDRCAELAWQGPSLAPFMHLAVLDDSDEVGRQARVLQTRLANPQTERERYLKAVLDTVMQRRQRQSSSPADVGD
jgi:hypothetical protein